MTNRNDGEANGFFDELSTIAPQADDPRVVEAAEEYLALLEDGREPNREEFLRRHAEIAPTLSKCLDGLCMVHGALPSLQKSGSTSPALGVPAIGPSPALPLGDFRIVREIGRGGMGIVYEAEQLSLGRRVALKVLPYVAALDPKHLQRFKNEAQAAALLHHPHIVPVYAVGSESGYYFYAMQFIDGWSLASLIGDLRARPTESAHPTVSEMLTERSSGGRQFYRRIARLGAQAAEALEHAHQMGVVHRDVKPSNLLLDEKGNLWVTDFGLARLQSDVRLTRTGELIGTARYMSPEQALGRSNLVDHRADVYALGATLYELLALRPLFDSSDRQELLRQIAVMDPRPLRQVAPNVPAELETIIQKALAKEPAERYASAAELAADLQAFAEDRPIRARPPTVAQRIARWSRRHRPVVWSAAVLLGLSVAGLAVGTLLIAQEHGKVLEAYAREQQKAEEAEKNFQQAREAVDFLVQISEDEMSDRAFLTDVRRKILEGALAYYQKFLFQHRDNPALRAELSNARSHMQQILGELTSLPISMQLELVNQASIRKDLNLSSEQTNQLAALRTEWTERERAASEESRKALPGVRRERLQKLNAETSQRLKEILTADQARRVQQIIRQSVGPMVFMEPEVVSALSLSPEQEAKIYAVHLDFSRSHGPRPGAPSGDGERRGPRTGPHQRMQSSYAEILALLTEEQRARWNEMVGEPFQGEMGFPFPFGGPGGPRGGHGPGGPPPDWPPGDGFDGPRPKAKPAPER